MSSYPRSPYRDIPPIEDAAVEALLAGSLPRRMQLRNCARWRRLSRPSAWRQASTS